MSSKKDQEQPQPVLELASKKIVVGVDGSSSSIDALRYAVHQAQTTGADVHAVTAWEVPATFGYAPSYSDVDWAALAHATVKLAVEKVLGEVADTDPVVTVTTPVARGHASTVLVAESQDADLLVVGSRGHGTAAEMLLGSVSQHCVHHAACLCWWSARSGRENAWR